MRALDLWCTEQCGFRSGVPLCMARHKFVSIPRLGCCKPLLFCFLEMSGAFDWALRIRCEAFSLLVLRCGPPNAKVAIWATTKSMCADVRLSICERTPNVGYWLSGPCMIIRRVRLSLGTRIKLFGGKSTCTIKSFQGFQ